MDDDKEDIKDDPPMDEERNRNRNDGNLSQGIDDDVSSTKVMMAFNERKEVSQSSHRSKSDIAFNHALKLEDEKTNLQLKRLAKSHDQLRAKLHEINNRLADPNARSQRLKEKKAARLRKRMERESRRAKRASASNPVY